MGYFCIGTVEKPRFASVFKIQMSCLATILFDKNNYCECDTQKLFFFVQNFFFSMTTLPILKKIGNVVPPASLNEGNFCKIMVI